MLYISNKSLFFIVCIHSIILYGTPNVTIANLIQEYHTVTNQRQYVIQRKKFLHDVLTTTNIINTFRFNNNIQSLQQYIHAYKQESVILGDDFLVSQTAFFKLLETYFRQNKSDNDALLPDNLHTTYKYIKKSSPLLYTTSVTSTYNKILKIHNEFYTSLKGYLSKRQSLESINEHYLLKIDPTLYNERNDPEHFFHGTTLFTIDSDPEDYLQDTTLLEIPEQQISDTDWTCIPHNNKARLHEYDSDDDFIYNMHIFKHFGTLPKAIEHESR